MDSFILEDVNELLNLKKGDTSRLNRIKEDSQSKGIISLPDRKYVERLSSQYLHQHEQIKPEKQNISKFVPIEEKENFHKKDGNLTPNQTPQIEKPVFSKEQFTYKLSTEKVASKKYNLKLNKNIIFSIGAIALAIILIVVVTTGFDGIQFPINSGNTQSNTLSDFSLEIDKTSYETSDIISISGKMSSSSTGNVKLSIENESSDLIWTENVNLKNSGEFSTLLIAGGAGWDNNGKYFLNVEHNEFSNSISFDYIAK